MVIRREEVVQCAVLVRVAACAGRELRSAPLNALSQIYRLLKATKGRSRVKKGPCKACGSMNNSLMGSRYCCQAQLIRYALNSSKYFLITSLKSNRAPAVLLFWVSDSELHHKYTVYILSSVF